MNDEQSLAEALGGGEEGAPQEQKPLHYAGALRRLSAFLIDAVVVVFMVTGGAVALGPYLKNETSPFFAVAAFGLFIVQVILPFFYVIGFTAASGATPGKRALGIRVIQASGEEKLGLETVFLREVAGKFVSLSFLGIGFLMILWDKKKQGLHDKIAKTVVVRNKYKV